MGVEAAEAFMTLLHGSFDRAFVALGSKLRAQTWDAHGMRLEFRRVQVVRLVFVTALPASEGDGVVSLLLNHQK